MQNKQVIFDYSTVTETPDTRASQEQITRLYTRYRFASEFCDNKDVLEVACGSGIGLGYLAKVAKWVVGGDIDENNLKLALEHYNGHNNIEIKLLDAHNLSFKDKSFDVVILYEAIYYLHEPEKFVAEARRVLRDNGVLIICTVNKDWAGFNPSPYSHKYFSTLELYEILNENGFINIEMYGDCPVKTNSIKDKSILAIKKTAVTLHLIPQTMKGKELLKRIFFGKLIPLPSEIEDGVAEYIPPVRISHNFPVNDFKVLYALAFKGKR
ncbi:MAG: class I SAM-dependent methyltransferase [Nitrospirota bacterium]